MQVSIVLPDEVVFSLQTKWGSLEQHILEMIVIEAYREGSISIGKVRELLGISTRLEVDSFLKERGIDLNYDQTDLEADRQTHEQLKELGKLNSL